MRAFIATELELSDMQMSHLCEDAGADAASSFKSTPEGTLQFLAAFGRISHDGTYLALITGTRGFTPTPADRHLIGEVKQLEAALESSLQAIAQSEGTNLLRSLGLST